MPLKRGRISLMLVFLATALSVWDGVFNLLSVLVFSGHEKALTWWSIYLPASLWAIALVAYRFPRTGVSAYLLILLTAITLCVDPFSHSGEGIKPWLACSSNVRMACIGAVLLLVNMVLQSRTDQQRR
jgi:hypothetical protein